MNTIERPLAIASDGSNSDCALLAALREGDHDALTPLYDRYRRLVFRVSNRMLCDADAAEDVVQSVFFSIWSAPPAIAEGTLASWLTFVTRNRARDVLRSRASRRESAFPANLIAVEACDEIVHQHLEYERVRTAVAVLPSSQRVLIELGFYGECTHAELAKLTQLPLGTIKTRIRAGLQKLRWSFAMLEGERAL